jgi:hypothetical protein
MMLRFITARRLAAVLAVLAAVALSVPASAQSTGMVKGRVLDAQGQPVEGARVSIEFMSGMTRKFEVKTNKKGEYIQIGLSPGQYKLTAEKDKLGSQSFDVRVGLGATLETNFTLNPSAVPSMTKEEATKLDALKKVFDAGVAASQANNHDEAIARFTEAAGMRADCYACYYNMGSCRSRTTPPPRSATRRRWSSSRTIPSPTTHWARSTTRRRSSPKRRR